VEKENIEGISSSTIDIMSKHNDGKKSGYGHTLLVLSARSKKFVLVKDGIRYETDTLKEIKSEFKGFFIKSETWLKLKKRCSD